MLVGGKKEAAHETKEGKWKNLHHKTHFLSYLKSVRKGMTISQNLAEELVCIRRKTERKLTLLFILLTVFDSVLLL